MAPISKRTTLLMENGLTKQKIIRTLKKNRKYRKKSHGDKNTTDTDVKEEINDELDSMEQELYDPELEVKEEIEDLTITKDDLKKIKEEINDTFESSEPELCQPQFDVKHEIDEIDIKDVDLQSSDIEVHDHPLEDNGDGVLLHKCQECNFISPHLHSIKRHFKSHLKTQYKCDNCSFVSLRSLDYRTHIIFCKNNSSDINVTEGTEGADEETLDIDIEKLISLVYERPCLWEVKSADYASKSVRKTAWEEIVLQFAGENSTMTQKIELAAACKQKWQELKDEYRRALNKKKGKSGQAAKNIKKWKYEEEMSFVASFLDKRKTLESVELTSKDEESQNNDAATEVQNDAVYVAASKNTTDTEIQNDDDTIIRDKSSQPQHRQAKKAKAKKRTLPERSASAVLMSRLLDTQSIPQQREHDELDLFFLNISETIKKFSPYLQAVAKKKIFNIVSEIELQQLASRSFITTTP